MAYTVSMREVKKLLNYAIDNNLKLEESGITPIAVSLEAGAGIGKTSVVQQVAEERNMQFKKISLHELDEVGDLIGFPVKEYECQILQRYQDDKGEWKVKTMPTPVWVNEKQLGEAPGPNMKYRQTGKNRMGYAKPAWVPDYSENGTVVVLDDYGRATAQLMQACMELILTQKYVSWSLPKKTTIVMTANPDNGDYNVNSLDEAQRTRFLNFPVAFDLDAWALWAEKAKLDGRCINFVMNYANELFNSDEDGNHICNPRSYVMFANMISGVKDWEVPENLEFIKLIAKGCFKDEGGRFNEIFASFIRNKMHLLIQPKDVLLGDWKTIKQKLEDTMYDGNGQYRADLASLIERRFVNYVSFWLDSDGETPISKVVNRIVDFIDNEKMIFNQDLLIHMIKTITSDHKRQTQKLLYEPKIAKIVM